jgi:PAS domain S-box-containing protein
MNADFISETADLADLFDLAPAGYFVVDQNGLVLKVNQAGTELLGVEKAGLLNCPLTNYIVPDDQEAFLQHCQRVVETEAPHKLTLRLKKQDGANFEAQVESNLGLGSGQDLKYLRMILIDVSELQTRQPEPAKNQKSQSELSEECKLLRNVIDSLPDYIYVKDMQSRFVLLNDATCRHMGANSAEEVIGKTDFDFAPPEYAARYYADEQQLLQSGHPMLLREEPNFDHETQTNRWVLTVKVPFYDEEGQRIGLVGMTRDITKLKKTEQALRYAHDELEMRVLQRTADLVKANEELQAEINERIQAEKASRESEERLRWVVQNMPVMMNAIDDQGTLIVWNRECERVTGYKAEEIVDNPQAMEWLYPDEAYRQQMLDIWTQHEDDYRNREGEITSKDGSVKTVAWSDISHQFPIPGWASWGIGVDITERKRVEEALRQSEQRYKQLLGSVTDYIYTVHIEYGRVARTTHSPNCVAVTGYTAEEYDANPNLWYQMIYEEDRAAVTRQAALLIGGHSVSPLEHRITHKDGSIRWVRNTPVLRKDDYGHHVVSYDGLITDITARKLAEEALRKSESKYRLLMEHASDGIIISDQYGNLLNINTKICEMLDRSRDSLLGLNMKDLISPEDLAAIPLALEEIWAGQTVLKERQMRRGTDGLIPVEISAKLIEPDRILAIIRDISERKAVEQREKLAYDLGRRLTTLLDREALLTETVNRLTETFGYYHTHVFLLDDRPPHQPRGQRLLVVQEGTGEAGTTLKEQAHAIPVDTQHSVVAQAARALEPIIVNDVSHHPNHLANPFLPRTQSEAAIPLHLGARLIGVLDVQHNTTNRFTSNEMRTLQIVASQLSVALANAKLFTENARRLAIIENSSDLVALFYRDSGLIIDINPAGVELLGFSKIEEIIYKPLARFYSPEGFAQIETKAIPTATRQGVWRGENEIFGRDGIAVPVSQSIFVIHNEQDQLPILATIMTDITQRKQAEQEQQRLFEEVKAGRKRLQTLSHRLVEVQEAERRHIARELHDEVGQLLTGLKLTLEMSASLPNKKVGTGLDEAQTLVNELIAQTRELSLELRPAMLDDLGLLPTLLWHFERYTNQTQVQVNFHHDGLDERLTPAVETAAYRIVQEALTNVARYAGVGQVTVQVWFEENHLNVVIEDQGSGFDLDIVQSSSSTSGLSGMVERAVLLGGQLSIETRPGAGTSITARLPLQPA